MTKLKKSEKQTQLHNAISAFTKLLDKDIKRVYGIMLTASSFKLFVANQQNEITEITKRAAHFTGMTYNQKLEAISLKGTGYNKIDAACDEINLAIAKHIGGEKRFTYERL